MTWNYRLVNMAHENGGEPWVQIMEVYYDDTGKPNGYADATLGSETVDSCKEVLAMMQDAFNKPVLNQEDFNT